MTNETMVRMGELAVSKDPGDVFTALGLGSCIGLCAYDPVVKVAAMAHVVLPTALSRGDSLPAKSADAAVPNLLAEMVKLGAVERRIRVVIAGGAQIFAFKNADVHMDVGARNSKAVTELLEARKIKLIASDTGGGSGRTVKMYVDSGTVGVRVAGKPEYILAKLSP